MILPIYKLIRCNSLLDIDVPCNSSVGIESGDLPNHAFLASSYKSGHFAYHGRLNNRIRKINETKRIWGAWCADDADKNQYIQVYREKSSLAYKINKI